MELYSRKISPFAARVRISIQAKNLPVRIIDSPDVNSVEFARLNPLRRVPVLVFEDGRTLPESDAIVEYLEDAYPQVSLRPTDPADRAHVRLVARVAELYVFPAAVPIFAARAAGDTNQIAVLFDSLNSALGTLSSFLETRNQSWHACGTKLTTADGALAPFLFYAHVLGRTCGRDAFAKHGRLQGFWDGAQSDPTLSTVLREMGEAMRRASAHRSEEASV
jgi:glutathione S-transferase